MSGKVDRYELFASRDIVRTVVSSMSSSKEGVSLGSSLLTMLRVVPGGTRALIELLRLPADAAKDGAEPQSAVNIANKTRKCIAGKSILWICI